MVWCSVGEDVLNGEWAMYGTRLGCYLTNMKRDEFDFVNVRDFEWHDNYWNSIVAPQFAGNDKQCHKSNYIWDTTKLKKETINLGMALRQELNLELAELGEWGSKFFKATYVNPNRLGPMIKEDQVLKGVGSENE